FDSNGQPVSLTNLVVDVHPATDQVILDFTSVNLPDGTYDLHLIPAGIVDAAGHTLNLNGQSFFDVPFFKLTGDADGSRTVDAQDLLLVRQALGTSAGQPAFNPSSDLNNDGAVTSADLQIVSTNLGHTL